MQLILISLVVMLWMGIPASASARNIRLATPVWLFMPVPTALILDSPISTSISPRPRRSISPWHVPLTSAMSPCSTVNAMVVVSPNSVWTMSSTLTFAAAIGSKICAWMPAVLGSPLRLMRPRSGLSAQPTTTMSSMICSSGTISVPTSGFWLWRT